MPSRKPRPSSVSQVLKDLLRFPHSGGAAKKPWRSTTWKQHVFEPFTAGVVPPRFQTSLDSAWQRYRKKRSKANVRVKAQVALGSRWGGGLDEMFATRLLVDPSHGLNLTALQSLWKERVPTTDLVWSTTSANLGLGKGAASPLAGHTPALKNHTGRSTRGTITEQHGTRDGWREAAVLADLAAPELVGVKARLATVKYMMSPAEELLAQTTALGAHATPIYSVHSDLGDLRDPAHLKKLAGRIQSQRERLKWHSAAELLGRNLHALVPVDYQEMLHFAGGDPALAMQTFHAAVDAGHRKANTAKTSQTDDLRGRSLAKMSSGRERALSPPRR